MKRLYSMALVWLLVVAAPGPTADKQPVPAKTDQEPIQTKLKALFKAEYAKTDRAAVVALASKLVERAAEEKENHGTRYVMLTEAWSLAVRGGELDIAVRAARLIDQDFKDPDLKDALATSFAENYGGKDRLDDYKAIAADELSNPTSAEDQAKLGQKWQEAAKKIRTESRQAVHRRARFWLCEAMSSAELKGLARTEAEKSCQDVTKEIEKADAKTGRFSLYEGKWVVKYANKYTHEYVIKADGSLAFDKCTSLDGTVFTKKEEQKASLARRGGVIVVAFNNGKVIERLSLDGDKLVVDRFDPPSDYPKTPSNTGEGVKEK